MHPDEHAEHLLVEQIQAGNDVAFETLMQRYKRPMLNFAYRILGDAGEAEDVAQEAFVRVYRRIGEYRPRWKLSTWLFAITRHAAIDRLRYRQRHPTEPLEGGVAASHLRGPSDEAQSQELAGQIAAAIAELTEDQKTAMVLAEYHDLSHAEIAAIMRCSEKSVEARLYRARLALRRRLARWLSE